MHSLPLFVRLQGRPVILLGEGEAAEAKRRLLERAGARITAEEGAPAALAIVAIADEAAAEAAIARLRGRGVLVNAVDRPAACDFTLPAIVDRDPVLVAIGTGGVSAGLAAAIRQRLELLLPPQLGALARALHAARATLRTRLPDPGARRRAIAAMLAPGAALDPLGVLPDRPDPLTMLAEPDARRLEQVEIAGPDPDALTLRAARLLASADRIFHDAGMSPLILDRARADAARIIGPAPDPLPPGLSVRLVERAR